MGDRSSTDLCILPTLANKLGLRGILMCPKRDMGHNAEPTCAERPGEHLGINGQILHAVLLAATRTAEKRPGILHRQARGQYTLWQ